MRRSSYASKTVSEWSRIYALRKSVFSKRTCFLHLPAVGLGILPAGPSGLGLPSLFRLLNSGPAVLPDDRGSRISVAGGFCPAGPDPVANGPQCTPAVSDDGGAVLFLQYGHHQ